MSGPADDRGASAEDEEEWRYSLSDLEDDTEAGADDENEEGDGAGVAGSFSPSEAIEPGDIDPENALFVALGVLLGLSIVATYTISLFL